MMSVIEIWSVWDTSQLNPYREPCLVFIKAKLQFPEGGANKDDNFLAKDLKGRDIEIRQNLCCAKIYVSRSHAKVLLPVYIPGVRHKYFQEGQPMPKDNAFVIVHK